MKTNMDDFMEYLYVTGQLDELFEPQEDNQEKNIKQEKNNNNKDRLKSKTKNDKGRRK